MPTHRRNWERGGVAWNTTNCHHARVREIFFASHLVYFDPHAQSMEITVNYLWSHCLTESSASLSFLI